MVVAIPRAMNWDRIAGRVAAKSREVVRSAAMADWSGVVWSIEWLNLLLKSVEVVLESSCLKRSHKDA